MGVPGVFVDENALREAIRMATSEIKVSENGRMHMMQ